MTSLQQLIQARERLVLRLEELELNSYAEALSRLDNSELFAGLCVYLSPYFNNRQDRFRCSHDLRQFINVMLQAFDMRMTAVELNLILRHEQEILDRMLELKQIIDDA